MINKENVTKSVGPPSRHLSRPPSRHKVPLFLLILFAGMLPGPFACVNGMSDSNGEELTDEVLELEVEEDFRHMLVIVFDGMRSDYITPGIMPNLYELGQNGVIAKKHHVVYPSVTRVNSPSLATGSYPGNHGLVHNHLYIPSIRSDFFSVGSANNLMRMNPILTTTSLGEQLEKHNYTLFATGSGSTGTTLLLNHTFSGAGVWNARGLVPEDMEETALQVLGDFPERTIPNIGQNRWAVDAYLKFGLDKYVSDVTLMWINDPDGTAHSHGVGTPQTVSALRHVDTQLGRIIEGLVQRGIWDQTNIIVTSDHGFSTREGGFNLNNILGDRPGVITRGGNRAKQIFFTNEFKNNKEYVTSIVRLLQEDEGVGAIFTRPANKDDIDGWIEGTMSMDLIHYNHERSADIHVTAAWSDEKNESGYPGFTRQHVSASIAGHGTASPYEMQVTMIASGPDFKEKTVSQVPSGNVDIAPTILHLLDLPIPDEWDGRVMNELLLEGPNPASVDYQINQFETSPVEWNENYKMILYQAQTGGTTYLHKAEIRR